MSNRGKDYSPGNMSQIGELASPISEVHPYLCVWASARLSQKQLHLLPWPISSVRLWLMID